MLKVKDKYDYRREFCDALRSGKYKRISGGSPGKKPNQGCAIRVFAMINDLPLRIISPKGLTPYETLPYAEFEQMTGLDPDEIWNLNDCGCSFKRLADWIERQP